jgi:outer membrane protein insertion porin family
MREAAGQTSKSSLSYSYTIDTRNDKIAPTTGYYAKLFNEFAGLGGDASFFKNEAEGHVSRPIFDGIVCL